MRSGLKRNAFLYLATIIVVISSRNSAAEPDNARYYVDVGTKKNDHSRMFAYIIVLIDDDVSLSQKRILNL